MKNNELKGTLSLLLAALIWGFALVSQKTGAETLGPLSFTGIRCLLGSFALVPLFMVLDRGKSPEQKAEEHNPKLLIKGGIVCGLIVFTFTILQQTGIAYTVVGTSGFITALYIIIVPVAGIFLHRKVGTQIWICVLIAMGGFYLICASQGFHQLNKGDMMMLAAAFGCAAHIYAIDYFVKKLDPIKFSSLQFFVTGLISLVLALIIEKPAMDDIMTASLPLLYSGVVSGGLGYMFQIIGQKYVEPAKASLLLSSETVFTLTTGMIFFHEILTPTKYIGCALIFFAIILSQLNFTNLRKGI